MAIFCQLRSLAPYNPGWVTSAGPMQALNLDPKQPPVVKRPASEFPEAADVYVCDKCGRDMTRHLYRGRAHVRQPLGPVRYFCCCGQDYLSGATEWDYLSNWEKRQWLKDVPLIFIFFAMLGGCVIVVYFAVVRRNVILFILSFAAVPFGVVSLRLFIVMSALPFQIAASLLRTRAFRKG
jgi:lipid-A-disaccharide synthase-like uncharacterized protein